MRPLTGLQKAAIFMISLGVENSAKIIRHLSDSEVERVTAEMANSHKVSQELRGKVLEEFSHMFMAQEAFSSGGIEYAKGVLERAFGSQKAVEIISRLANSSSIRPFDFVRTTDPKQLAAFIQGEHPQTIALIMSYLMPERAGLVLSALDQEIQPEVAKRIAVMGQISPEIVREIEGVLKRKVTNIGMQNSATVGGIKSVVDVLNRVDHSTVKNIMDSLDIKEPELAESIKSQMFVFEDIVQLDDRAIQQVLRQVENRDLAVALKGGSDVVAAKIKKNMSSRAAALLKEDMEYMGPIRLRDVEEAQSKIVKIIRQLEESGEIVISRGGQDELIY